MPVQHIRFTKMLLPTLTVAHADNCRTQGLPKGLLTVSAYLYSAANVAYKFVNNVM